MKNSDIIGHLSGADATLAEELPVPIAEMDAKHLEAAGFSKTGVHTIRAICDEKPWLPLTRVNGVGPKTAKGLYENYDIENPEQLEERFQETPTLGIDNEDHIRRAIDWVDEGRIDLEDAHDIVDAIKWELGDYFSKLKAVGSYRRKKETVGDIDMLSVPSSPTSDVQDAFKEMCDYTIRCGDKKMTGRFKNVQVDIQMVTHEEWPAALQYFTGSQDHNIKLRRCAKEDDLKLNEYGLWQRSTDERVSVETERELYERLLGEYIPPEKRS